MESATLLLRRFLINNMSTTAPQLLRQMRVCISGPKGGNNDKEEGEEKTEKYKMRLLNM